MEYDLSAIRAALLAIGAECSARIDDLNRGGCGVYAYNVARQLAKRGIPHRIRTYGTLEIPLEELADNLRRQQRLTDGFAIQSYGDACYHVAVEWDGKVWDSEGARSPHRHYVGAYMNDGYLPLWALKAWNRASFLWNDWYDRRQNDKVARIVAKHFRKLDRGDYDAETRPNPDEWLLRQSAGGAI